MRAVLAGVARRFQYGGLVIEFAESVLQFLHRGLVGIIGDGDSLFGQINLKGLEAFEVFDVLFHFGLTAFALHLRYREYYGADVLCQGGSGGHYQCGQQD